MTSDSTTMAQQPHTFRSRPRPRRRALKRATAATLLSFSGVAAQGQYQSQGCVAIGEPYFDDNLILTPNGLGECHDYCETGGYGYFAVWQQYVFIP